MTARRTKLYALAVLLSVPPGFGVTGFVAMTTGGGSVTPTALAVGAATTLAFGGLVLVAGVSGDDGDAAA